jgi:hypothetical protein
VFVSVPDAVGAGIVASLSRPGGNTTGFTSTELGMSVIAIALNWDMARRRTKNAAAEIRAGGALARLEAQSQV